MTALPSDRRRQLENVVREARDVAETAARAALDRLGVAEARPWDHLSAPQKELRNRLRAHGRQLGDTRKANGEQETERLVIEVAYQQWHRMLFARFLAENHLLIHPELGVPVTLEECEELAAEEGAEDGWVLAGRFAARMLPQIFRPGEPALALSFAPEHQRRLEQLLESLPAETFTASDALGWVYQFWQGKKKDEVNRSGVKIGADGLPAVTQLFTEPYMVQFLLHNTLGAWWVGRQPGEDLPIEMEYLRRLEDGTPAAGTFDGWPTTTRELRVLDPCCGSGHFLVAAFHILVAFRMREEGISARETCDRVIAENLFGLEIDERCTQIAAFALALAAWTYPGAGGYRPLPEMNIACSGLAVGAKREEWLALAGEDVRLREGMSRLYALFKDAPVLGSLIDPKRRGGGDLLTGEFSELQPLLQKALDREKKEGGYAGEEIGITAQGIAKAADLLGSKYHLVCTNVPYLARGKQDLRLREYLEEVYPNSKTDLATAFVERSGELTSAAATYAVVSPQNWMFLLSYKSFRAALLQGQRVNLIATLGAQAFQTPMWDFKIGLFVFTNSLPLPQSILVGVDASKLDTPSEKAEALRLTVPFVDPQLNQIQHPDSIITLVTIESGTPLREHARVSVGLQPGETVRLTRSFWETPEWRGWRRLTSSPDGMNLYRGNSEIIVDPNRFDSIGVRSAVIRGTQAWSRPGVVISKMGQLHASLYTGCLFDDNTCVITPHKSSDLGAVWAFASSPEFYTKVRKLNKKLSVTATVIGQVTFDVDKWRQIAEEQYPDGVPEPYSNDPTQWLFKGEVPDTTEPLQVAVARLLGYRWPDQEPDALDELVDDDGIVCIPPVRGEAPAADRLRALLARAFGSEWSAAKERALLEQTGAKSKTLEDWLRNELFEQHFKLFHHRPFIWHIWDGTRNGFSVLVNYHKLDRKRLELLTYTYLGDWIRRHEHAQRQGESGADEKLRRARELQKKLELILEGEAPYDIFVRWKPLEEQPIGWEPDLNDGVRMNIRPFFEAGVLRKNPNIKWGKDRGKDPADAPWGEERINDRHLTLAEKHAARGERKAG